MNERALRLTNKHALGWAFLVLILEDKELSILDH